MTDAPEIIRRFATQPEIDKAVADLIQMQYARLISKNDNEEDSSND